MWVSYMDLGPKKIPSETSVLLHSFKKAGILLVFCLAFQTFNEGLTILVLFFVGEDLFYFRFRQSPNF